MKTASRVRVEVFRVVCDACHKPFHETEDTLDCCPHCQVATSAADSGKKTTYEFVVNPITGKFVVLKLPSNYEKHNGVQP